MRFFLFLLSLIPQFAFAQDAADPTLNTSTMSFAPPVTDLSVQYLGDIFGVVDGVLHGTGTQIMGAMFGVFNAAVLTLGGIVIMYTLIVGTLQTAHEGQVLGQKWNSTWIPIRSAAGFALLMPKATGYSFIQIFIMWVVVQGVGAADTVWNAAVNYLARGGTFIQANSIATSSTNQGLVGMAGSILKAQTCMFGIYNALQIQYAGKPDFQVPNIIDTIAITGQTTKNVPPTPPTPCPQSDYTNGVCSQAANEVCDCGGTISFPGNYQVLSAGLPFGPNYAGVCGSVSWNFTRDGGGGMAGTQPGGTTTPYGQAANPTQAVASDSRSIAIQQVILDTQPIAQALVALMLPPPLTPPPPNYATAFQTWQTANQNDLVYAAEDYLGIMGPYLNYQSMSTNASYIQALEASKANGWILAGDFYYQFAKIGNSASSGSEKSSDIPQVTLSYGNDFTKTIPSLSTEISALNPNSLATDTGLTNTTFGTTPPSVSANYTDQFINTDYTGYAKIVSQSTGTGGTGQPVIKPSTAGTGEGLLEAFGIAVPVLYPAIVLLVLMMQAILSDLNNLTNTNIDPILAIASMGNDIVTWVESIWFGGTIVAFWGTLAAALCAASNPLPYAIFSAMLWFIPMLFLSLTGLAAAGATMAYYVPLIPFILFLFTALGWFIAVIEAMVAAPLVALGIAHPEGQHEIFGKAEPAVMIIANTFMRPTLIVIGFIVGAILSRVALWLLSQGFAQVIPNVPTDPFAVIFIVTISCVYVGIALAIVNRCFSLIHELPARVFRFISGQVEEYGEARAAGEVKQAAEAGAGAAFGAMKSGTEAGKGAIESGVEGMRKQGSPDGKGTKSELE